MGFCRDGLRRIGIAAFACFCMLASASIERAGAQTGEDAVYRIDGAASTIYWRVYKAGAFARLGHNHVVSVPEPSGVVVLRPALSESTVEIEFAVDELVIDDPELRALLGDDFASVPSAEDIEGTRGNMLGDDVLDAANFPSIRVSATGLSGIGADQQLDLRIEVLGRAVDVSVPAAVTFNERRLTATGEFRLTHEALGMDPFSVMMGALQVGENLDFTYEIHAERSE